MTRLTRPMFRPAALPTDADSGAEPICPRFVSAPTLRCVFALCALLTIGGASTGSTRIPSYVSGSAIAVEQGHSNVGALVVVLLPPEALHRLRPGQKLRLQSGAGHALKPRPVVAVEPDLLGPVALRERFSLRAHCADSWQRPAAVATALLEPSEEGSGWVPDTGVLNARIEVGSRRAASLAPLIGQWFAQEDP
jgi:hypothetical protein